VHVVVHTDAESRPKVDLAAIESRIAEAALTWAEPFWREVVVENKGEAAGIALSRIAIAAPFPMAYEEDVDPRDTLDDLADLEALREQAAAASGCRPRPAPCA